MRMIHLSWVVSTTIIIIEEVLKMMEMKDIILLLSVQDALLFPITLLWELLSYPPHPLLFYSALGGWVVATVIISLEFECPRYL